MAIYAANKTKVFNYPIYFVSKSCCLLRTLEGRTSIFIAIFFFLSISPTFISRRKYYFCYLVVFINFIYHQLLLLNTKTTVLEKFVLRLANAFNPRMKFSYIITLFMLNTNFNDVSFTPNF